MLSLIKRFPITTALYVLTIVGIVWGIFDTRAKMIAQYSSEKAQRDWETWRSEATTQTNDGTVERRQPKSLEPPALVLMRDHFTVVVIAGVVFGSMLFFMLAVAVHGTLAKPPKSTGN